MWAIAISRERNLLSGSFQDSQVTFLCIIAVVRYLLLIKLSDLAPGQFPNDLLSGGAAQRPCLCGPAHGSMSCGPAYNKPVRPSGTDARIYHNHDFRICSDSNSGITSALETAKSGANLASDRKVVFFSKSGMCLGGFLWPLFVAGPSHVNSNDADLFTKIMSREPFEMVRNRIMVEHNVHHDE